MKWTAVIALTAWLGATGSAWAQDDVQAAADAFDHAQQVGDQATLARMLADDLIFIRMTGVRAGKKEFIANFSTAGVVLEPFAITNKTMVRLGPDAAIVGGEARMRGTRNGEPFAQHFFYSDTFLRTNGRWTVVHVQVTPIP
jgi:ketosteroid isomerase-like protein